MTLRDESSEKFDLKLEKDTFKIAHAADSDWLHNEKENRTIAIIPCLNEEATIGSVVLRARRYVDEVLVIDDGSIDDTKQIAREAGATVVSHKINKGKSAGIKTGFKYSLQKDYDFIITLDGDGQHNPDEIPEVLGPLLNGNNIDISLGIRSGKDTEMPMWRRVGKRALDYATSFGNEGFITDSQCGCRAFSKNAVRGIVTKLNGQAFSVESEQLLRAYELGFNIVNTNISCRYKNLDTSTKRASSHGFGVLGYIIWLVAEKRPLLFIGVPGFIFVMIGIFWGILTLQWYNQHGIFLISYALITIVFLIMGALAMFIALMLNTLPHIIKRTIEQHKEKF